MALTSGESLSGVFDGRPHVCTVDPMRASRRTKRVVVKALRPGHLTILGTVVEVTDAGVISMVPMTKIIFSKADREGNVTIATARFPSDSMINIEIDALTAFLEG